MFLKMVKIRKNTIGDEYWISHKMINFYPNLTLIPYPELRLLFWPAAAILLQPQLRLLRLFLQIKATKRCSSRSCGCGRAFQPQLGLWLIPQNFRFFPKFVNLYKKLKFCHFWLKFTHSFREGLETQLR